MVFFILDSMLCNTLFLCALLQNEKKNISSFFHYFDTCRRMKKMLSDFVYKENFKTIALFKLWQHGLCFNIFTLKKCFNAFQFIIKKKDPQFTLRKHF